MINILVITDNGSGLKTIYWIVFIRINLTKNRKGAISAVRSAI